MGKDKDIPRFSQGRAVLSSFLKGQVLFEVGSGALAQGGFLQVAGSESHLLSMCGYAESVCVVLHVWGYRHHMCAIGPRVLALCVSRLYILRNNT